MTFATAYYQSSREAEILSAEPVELICILYEAALEAVGQARARLRGGDIRGRSAAISRALDILAELAGSVDLERGGKLGRDLVELYDFMQRRLVEANTRQIEGPLGEVESLLRTLREGWTAAGERVWPQMDADGHG